MEDALISPESFMILSGAGLIDAKEGQPIYQHTSETIDFNGVIKGENVMYVHLSEKPYLPADKQDNMAYVMLVNKGEIVTEPYIPVHGANEGTLDAEASAENLGTAFGDGVGVVKDKTAGYWICVKAGKNYVNDASTEYAIDDFKNGESAILYDSALVDYYIARASGAKQIEITPDKFGGNYYLEASTLWRDTDGVDWPAEFIIPNCKIQSNFTFTMASSGDPSGLMRLAA